MAGGREGGKKVGSEEGRKGGREEMSQGGREGVACHFQKNDIL